MFPILHPLHSPSSPAHPPITGPVLHFCPSFFKVYIQRGFTMAFHPWIYCTFIRLTPSVTLPYPFPILPYWSTVFRTFHYAIFLHSHYAIYLHRCSIFCYCSLVSFSFPLPHPPVPSNSPTVANMLSLYLCIDHACICGLRLFKVDLLSFSATNPHQDGYTSNYLFSKWPFFYLLLYVSHTHTHTHTHTHKHTSFSELGIELRACR
jgi:hypothetical protein